MPGYPAKYQQHLAKVDERPNIRQIYVRRPSSPMIGFTIHPEITTQRADAIARSIDPNARLWDVWNMDGLGEGEHRNYDVRVYRY